MVVMRRQLPNSDTTMCVCARARRLMTLFGGFPSAAIALRSSAPNHLRSSITFFDFRFAPWLAHSYANLLTSSSGIFGVRRRAGWPARVFGDSSARRGLISALSPRRRNGAARYLPNALGVDCLRFQPNFCRCSFAFWLRLHRA